MTAPNWFDYLIEAAHNTAKEETVNGSPEPDRLLHLVLTWADAGQLGILEHDRAVNVLRNHWRVSLAAEFAVNTLHTHGFIEVVELAPVYQALRATDAGRVQLAEWDALVAGKPEPAESPVGTPTCLDDQDDCPFGGIN